MANVSLKTLIILPCYNEAQSIGNILQQLKNINIPDCELIALPVNDASTDKTLAEIKKHSNHYLDLPQNLGIGGAVQSGLKYAHENNFDIAIQMDARDEGTSSISGLRGIYYMIKVSLAILRVRSK